MNGSITKTANWMRTTSREWRPRAMFGSNDGSLVTSSHHRHGSERICGPSALKIAKENDAEAFKPLRGLAEWKIFWSAFRSLHQVFFRIPSGMTWKALKTLNVAKPLQVAMLAMLALGLQSKGEAQANLANFYQWSNQTMNVPPGSENLFVQILSANSAVFYGGFTTNFPDPRLVAPTLVGNLTTTPGATYNISFTMEQLTPIAYTTGGAMSFGNFTADLSSAISSDFYYTNNLTGGELIYPTNFDFTAVATTPTTTMSFSITPDNSGAISLYNLAVTEVPEMPVAGLFGCLGALMLLAQRWRRFFQKSEYGPTHKAP